MALSYQAPRETGSAFLQQNPIFQFQETGIKFQTLGSP
ncbi:hypothetical protein OROMI_022284 [Orobanche minor]